MNRIFDSSSIINLCVDRRVDRLHEGGTLGLAFYEVGNAVWKQVYQRKSLSLEEGEKALATLVEVLNSMKEVMVEDKVAVLNIAVERGLTYYDASFIRAAIENNSILITDDEILRSAAKGIAETAKSIDEQ